MTGAAVCGVGSERLSTSHSGIPAHRAMNGTASRTLIHTMVVIVCSPFLVLTTLPDGVLGIRQATSVLVLNRWRTSELPLNLVIRDVSRARRPCRRRRPTADR